MNIFDYALIPSSIIEELNCYLERRIKPSGFLIAILTNNLSETIRRSDVNNILIIPHVVAWLYNEAPSICWGNEERFHHWLDLRDE
jgi:hypothetical protein